MQDFAPFYPELLGALSGRIVTMQSSFETFIPIFCNLRLASLYGRLLCNIHIQGPTQNHNLVGKNRTSQAQKKKS
jgi:hypothetical protein